MLEQPIKPKGLTFFLIVVITFLGWMFYNLTKVDAKTIEETLYCYRITCPTQAIVFHEPYYPPEPDYYEIVASVSAYNTVEWQTDSTPCEATGGNICGRTAMACPRSIPLYTWVSIGDGPKIQCIDRLAARYDHRFDLSFDKDIKGAINWGIQTKTIRVYENK